MLLDAGNRTPENIGVLYTRRFHLGALCHSLTGARIPYEVAKADTAGALSLASPTVKLITVHSSKGYEFDVVFLVGLEQLPSPDGTIEKERQGRTGYVGMTRARDQLVITYSKDNAYLEHIRGIPQTLLRRWVWPDDYPEE
jgi:superfamily I DNA/RNA helicase